MIATDQDHARGIARLLADRVGVRPVVATSDDSDASDRIARFATGTEPWIVAVRMVAEGVDIPRLRVGVFATTTTTELFFRQAVRRLVRWTSGTPGQKSFLFIPDEPRLRARAFAIAEQRRHSLRHEDREQPETEREGAVDEQFSSSRRSAPSPLEGETEPDWALDGEHLPEPADDAALTIDLPPLPMRFGTGAAGASPPGRTRRDHKEHLRRANADKGRLIVRHTGLTHAGVNAELNRVSGIRRISDATVEQLERRLDKAENWLHPAPYCLRGGGSRILTIVDQ